MTAVLTSKGQVTIPKAVRDDFALAAGAVLDFDRQGAEMVVRVLKPRSRPKARIVRTPRGLRGVAPEPVDAAAVAAALARFP
jgi:AbrB family looped-hinge helix DNA binding protein